MSAQDRIRHIIGDLVVEVEILKEQLSSANAEIERLRKESRNPSNPSRDE